MSQTFDFTKMGIACQNVARNLAPSERYEDAIANS